MQTDAKTFAYMFQYPICNLCVVSLLYFIVYQRLTKFMTSTSLSALKGRMTKVIRFLYVIRVLALAFQTCKSLRVRSLLDMLKM